MAPIRPRLPGYEVEVAATDPFSDPSAYINPKSLWVDTSTNPPLFKVRNATNDGWLTIGVLVSSVNGATGAVVINGFTTVATSGGTSAVADQANDTLTLNGAGGTTINGNAATDTITVTSPALASTTPAALNTAAAVGVGTTSARADHVHPYPTPAQIGAQPADADLTALAALATTGFAVRTAADTWTQRGVDVAGTGLGVTNGNGVAGNPTLRLVFGDGFNVQEDNTAFSTNANAYVDAASFTYTAPTAGNYLLNLNWIFQNSATNRSSVFGIFVDGVLAVPTAFVERVANTKVVTPRTYSKVINLAAGSHTIALRTYTKGSMTVTVTNCAMQIWRAS